jgi:hypothetical protein
VIGDTGRSVFCNVLQITSLNHEQIDATEAQFSPRRPLFFLTDFYPSLRDRYWSIFHF